MFHNPQLGLLLLITHFLGSLTTGILFRNYHSKRIISQKGEKINKNPTPSSTNPPLNAKNIGYYIGNAIQTSLSTLLLILGYMVLSAVLVNIFENLHIISFFSSPNKTLLSPLFKGLIEVTSGIKAYSNIPGDKIVILPLVSFVLGFGGFSIFMQVTSIIAKTNLSILSYLLGKLTHGTLSGIYTYLILKYTNILNSNIMETISIPNRQIPIIHETSNLITVLCTLFLFAIFIKMMPHWKK